MALEWLEGMDLEAEGKLRKRSGLPPRALSELLDLLSGSARAIHLSHNFEREGGRYCVVHRDIKPENLFLAHIGGKEIVKVLDFGTSKVERMMNMLVGDPTNTGRPGQFSPAYGAPEQWVPASLGQTGPWTDVWGLALTLVELMKGSHVFAGNMQKAMFMSLDERTRPTPRNHGIDVSDGVEDAFRRALAVDPRERTQSVRDLWTELRAAVTSDSDDAPLSFGASEDGPIHHVSDSDLPFVLSDSSSRRPPRRRPTNPPQTGKFPIAGTFEEERHTLAHTGTDHDRSDTIRDIELDWDDPHG
jgi:serine/threonine-protein kinase